MRASTWAGESGASLLNRSETFTHNAANYLLYAGFLLGSFFDSEDISDISLRIVL
jgi:hypothetical protein